MRLWERVIRNVCWKVAQVGQVAIVAVTFLLVANIFLRAMWRFPVPGTVELTEIMGAVLLAGGVAYCHWVKGHVAVGVFVEKLPPRWQGFVDTVVNIVALAATVMLTKETFAYATSMAAKGYTTADLLIPLYPFIYFVAASFAMLAIVIFRDLMKAITLLMKGGERK